MRTQLQVSSTYPCTSVCRIIVLSIALGLAHKKTPCSAGEIFAYLYILLCTASRYAEP